MKTLTTLITGILISTTAMAQSVITRISGGEHYFYYDGQLQPIFDVAESGDTIILGGGQYPIATDVEIFTKVILIGTGIRPDSAAAYGTRTAITGNVNTDILIKDGADGTEFHGIATEDFGTIRFGDGTTLEGTDVDDCRFVRCHFEGLQLGNSVNGSLANNTQITECIIELLNVSNAPGTYVSNSVVQTLNTSNATANTQVLNCILLGGIPTGNEGVHYENCVFATSLTAPVTVIEASSYINNLFVGNGGGFSINAGPNVEAWVDNLSETILSGASGAFVNVANVSAYNFAFDYNVSAPYQIEGTDDEDLGVYGGAWPWKDGSMPFNPHWSELNGPGTTTNGVLQNVTIRGSAQTH